METSPKSSETEGSQRTSEKNPVDSFFSSLIFRMKNHENMVAQFRTWRVSRSGS
jgi:hypothetical protein